MRYIESPMSYDPQNGEKALFLAGGIHGCSDWQRDMVDLLRDTNLVVLNPRRAMFPIDDPQAKHEQVRWEYAYLRKAHAILFWFSPETLCPIVLYELGAWSMTEKPLYVGIHPDYQRKQDVEIQTNLVRPDIKITSTLGDLARQIKADLQR